MAAGHPVGHVLNSTLIFTKNHNNSPHMQSSSLFFVLLLWKSWSQSKVTGVALRIRRHVWCMNFEMLDVSSSAISLSPRTPYSCFFANFWLSKSLHLLWGPQPVENFFAVASTETQARCKKNRMNWKPFDFAMNSLLAATASKRCWSCRNPLAVWKCPCGTWRRKCLPHHVHYVSMKQPNTPLLLRRRETARTTPQNIPKMRRTH